MPRGVNLSRETRLIIWTRSVVDGWSPDRIFNDQFRADRNIISLFRLRVLHRMFRADYNKTTMYLAACRRRGNPGISNYVVLDTIMQILLDRFPQATIDFYYLQIVDMLGPTEASKYPRQQIQISIHRCRATLKRNTFFSDHQDNNRIAHHLALARDVNVEHMVNFDQCSCSAEKFRCGMGRGRGRVIVHEWTIAGHYFSAIAAATPRGILYFEVIEGTFSHFEVEAFVHNMQPLLPHGSVCLFDNASINVAESTLQVIDQVFNGNWLRNAEYCPQLAPIEKCFSVVWGYVRRRWIQANRRPLPTIIEAFEYYSVGGPGATAIRGFFNIYIRNQDI